MQLLSRAENHVKLALLLGLFLVVLGAKISIISTFGSLVPYWDQWDSEAAFLYAPYLDGSLSWSAMFAPHNEHRILLTRMLALGLLNISGEWDPIFEVIVNSLMHTVSIVLLTALLMRGLLLKQCVYLTIISAIVFSLPIGWENILSGFQSQFYLLALCSTACLAILPQAKAFSLLWLAAGFLAVLSYFSLAAGVFVFFIAGCVIIAQLLLNRRQGSAEWISAAIFLSAAVVGILFVQRVAAHDTLRAHSLAEFFNPLVTLLGFPFTAPFGIEFVFLNCLLVIVTMLPFAMLGWQIFAGRETSSRWFVVAAFALVVVQCVSLAFGRSVGFFSSRYLDILLPIVPLGYVAFCLTSVRGFRVVWTVVAVGCLLIFAVKVTIPNIYERRSQTIAQLENVKAFITTGDIATLENKPDLHIPYPSAARLAMLLSTPSIRAVLPQQLRPLDPATISTRASKFPHPSLYRVVGIAKAFALRLSFTMLITGVFFLLTAAYVSIEILPVIGAFNFVLKTRQADPREC